MLVFFFIIISHGIFSYQYIIIMSHIYNYHSVIIQEPENQYNRNTYILCWAFMQHLADA